MQVLRIGHSQGRELFSFSRALARGSRARSLVGEPFKRFLGRALLLCGRTLNEKPLKGFAVTPSDRWSPS
jgi:hypothetical protein